MQFTTHTVATHYQNVLQTIYATDWEYFHNFRRHYLHQRHLYIVITAVDTFCSGGLVSITSAGSDYTKPHLYQSQMHDAINTHRHRYTHNNCRDVAAPEQMDRAAEDCC